MPPESKHRVKKGPNAAAPSMASKFEVVPTNRVHLVMPGDQMKCQLCGVLQANVKQHMNACAKAVYYTTIQNKCREGYLYLVQRHNEQPAEWDAPGDFVMYSPSIIMGVMEKLPMAELERQVNTWNVLMPLKTKYHVEGEKSDGKTFFEYVQEVIDERGGMYKATYHVQSLGGGVETDWDLSGGKKDHVPPPVRFTHREQDVMEDTRLFLLTLKDCLGRKLPCTGNAAYIGNDYPNCPYLIEDED